MPKVLVVASTDLSPELGETVLWSGGVQRVFSTHGGPALATARQERPNMVVVDAEDSQEAVAFIRRLRADPAARCTSVAAVSRTTDLRDEEVLRRAGANLVFSGRVDPTLWDRRLELLLNVPRRRETRFPMLVDPWAGLGPTSDPRAAWSINISVRGVLVETGDPMDLGTKLDMRFTLPDDTDPVQAVGQVVREAGDMGERARSGVEFLILLGKARDRIAWFVDRTGEA